MLDGSPFIKIENDEPKVGKNAFKYIVTPKARSFNSHSTVRQEIE
jgi:hypothetical protein